MGNLTDSEGNAIWAANKWYKIMLADGSELGFTTTTAGRLNCGPRPSGQGAIFRYRRDHNVEGSYGWPEGDIGYLKALAYGSDGRVYSKHLSLSGGAPADLAFYDTDNSYGFIAKQAAGGRLLLYARDENQKMVGLRVQIGPQMATQSGLEIQGQPTPFMIALDCSFVPCGPYDNDWKF